MTEEDKEKLAVFGYLALEVGLAFSKIFLLIALIWVVITGSQLFSGSLENFSLKTAIYFLLGGIFFWFLWKFKKSLSI